MSRPMLREDSALETRFARRITAVLARGASDLPHDVSERLRVSRERALESGRWASVRPSQAAATSHRLGSRSSLPASGPGWGWRLASLLPVVAMVGGLVLIQSLQDDDHARAAADIDLALLADDLPPEAYADAGFAEYLRKPDL